MVIIFIVGLILGWIGKALAEMASNNSEDDYDQGFGDGYEEGFSTAELIYKDHYNK